jgi:hypothetical protein
MRERRSEETHVISKFKQWLSLLAKPTRDIEKTENTTYWVIWWEKKVIEEQPSEYAGLEGQERRLLTRAGQFMFKRYSRALEREKRSHRLGTQARRAALERFIYHFERYLIPVLKRCPSRLRRDALEYAINSAVLEYSAVGAAGPFYSESTLALLKAAKVGLGIPSELYSKCEADLATRPLVTVHNFINSFMIDWDQQLVRALEDIFGNRPFNDVSLYDALMMTISKLPEHRLSDCLESQGVDKAELNVSATKLLSVANRSK